MTLKASISSLAFLYNGGTASADPYIFVSPTFLNADEYSIEVSPNIGNFPASAVPELGTWAMMLLGFAGLGWAAYRRASPERGWAPGIARAENSH